MARVKTGLENLIQKPPERLKNRRLGLLCHPASVDMRFVHARDLVRKVFPGQLRALYSPQHGFFGEKQDNMIESDHLVDPRTNLPVYSLYGDTRKPTEKMLESIDVLLVDLVDVGTRVYTFATTVAYCMEVAANLDRKVVILDRPNPVGGHIVEGNVLLAEYRSFVGPYPIPMRHGLTLGELCLLYNRFFNIGCDLEVIRMDGWRRRRFFDQTGLPWVAPSPNLPTFRSALVYPGQVIWEGTNISEGRGTTLPFELFGAPFLEPQTVLNQLAPEGIIEGAVLRETAFEPTFHKWKGKLCGGFQIHVTRPEAFRAYETSLRLLQAVCLCFGSQFQWKSPPYEYEYERFPIDLIIGDKQLRERLENGERVSDLAREWTPALEEFMKMRKEVLLYS